jgi:type I restriction-modification system DNA methylase subunit
MIPLTVLRRLDCVLESSKDQVIDYHRKLKADDKYDVVPAKFIRALRPSGNFD